MFVPSRALQAQEQVVLRLPHRFTAAGRIGIAQHQLRAKVVEDQFTRIVVAEHERDTRADQVREAKLRRRVVGAIVEGAEKIVLVGPDVGIDGVLLALRLDWPRQGTFS